MKHFLSSHRRTANRLTRGGSQAPILIDQAVAEHGDAAGKVAISHLRQRLREKLCETVAETLGPDDDLEAEMLHLLSLLAAR